MTSKIVKVGWHLAVLIPASVCGTYNATREDKRWFHHFLTALYGTVIAVEIICILDDIKEGKC